MDNTQIDNIIEALDNIYSTSCIIAEQYNAKQISFNTFKVIIDKTKLNNKSKIKDIVLFVSAYNNMLDKMYAEIVTDAMFTTTPDKIDLKLIKTKIEKIKKVFI